MLKTFGKIFKVIRESKNMSLKEVAAGDISVAQLYGFRVWGGNWPWDPAWRPGSSAGFITDIDEHCNRFNPKIGRAHV